MAPKRAKASETKGQKKLKLSKDQGAADAAVPAKEEAAAATKDAEMKQTPAEPEASPEKTISEASPEKAKPELTEEQRKRIEENRQKAMAKKLTAEQANRIEENRQKALARKLAAQANQSPSPQKGTTPNVAEATPEKTGLPQQERRQLGIATAGNNQACVTHPARERTGQFGYLESGVWQQYNSLYATRLRQLRPAVLEEAQAQWGDSVAADNFVPDVTGYNKKDADGNSLEVVIVGMVFKELKARPNVIAYYRDLKVGQFDTKDEAAEKVSLSSDTDVLWVEDSLMRVQVVIEPETVARFPTGVVAAFRGTATPDGNFKASAFSLTKVRPPTALTAEMVSNNEGSYLAFISGIAFSDASEDACSSAALSRAVKFLSGKDADASAKVSEVIWCGDALAVDREGVDAKAALKEADALFADLAGEVPVHLLPGRSDPSNLSLPQKPLHPHLFKRVRECKQFKSVTNPYHCSVRGVAVVGHSGQPVDDILKCTRLEAPADALETCLKARHLAPTAPDTLAMQPFTLDDPFVMQEAPHVLFSGGHERAAHAWHSATDSEQGTLCVCVPDFRRQPAVVLVNLANPRDVRVQEFA